jgi:hypothetical protein
MHLILWVLALLVALSLCVSVATELSNYSIDADCARDQNMPMGITVDGVTYCDWDTFASQAEADWYFRSMEALAAFSVLMLIAHFTLFVLACVETDRRRKFGKKTKVVYLMASQNPADGRTYYMPVDAAQALGGAQNRASVLAPQPPAQHRQPQQDNADPGIHGYYAPPANVAPGTAA